MNAPLIPSIVLPLAFSQAVLQTLQGPILDREYVCSLCSANASGIAIKTDTCAVCCCSFAYWSTQRTLHTHTGTRSWTSVQSMMCLFPLVMASGLAALQVWTSHCHLNKIDACIILSSLWTLMLSMQTLSASLVRRNLHHSQRSAWVELCAGCYPPGK